MVNVSAKWVLCMPCNTGDTSESLACGIIVKGISDVKQQVDLHGAVELQFMQKLSAVIRVSPTCGSSTSDHLQRCVLPSKLPSRPAVCDTHVRAPGLVLSCRCQAFLRGLLGAIPVTSSGVNLLEDSYQRHVMFAFSPQFRQLPHRHLNTLLSSTLEGHFYLPC